MSSDKVQRPQSTVGYCTTTTNLITYSIFQCEERAKNVLKGGGGSGSEGEDESNEMEENKMETHPDFWDAITLFVMQGKVEHARTLLRLHSEMGTDPLVSLDELLKKMPVYDMNTTSVAKFEIAWRRWQTEVVARIDEGDFVTDPNLSSGMVISCAIIFHLLFNGSFFCGLEVEGKKL